MSMMICNATLIDSNVPSVTGKMYTADVLKRIAKKAVVYGEIGPSIESAEIQPDKCSHKIVNLDVRNGVLYGDVEILQNSMSDLFNMFGQYRTSNIEFRPRGFGKIAKNSKTVIDFDIVALDCYMNEVGNGNT